jgi:DNA-binding beta-propeller fold protein YncE
LSSSKVQPLFLLAVVVALGASAAGSPVFAMGQTASPPKATGGSPGAGGTLALDAAGDPSGPGSGVNAIVASVPTGTSPQTPTVDPENGDVYVPNGGKGGSGVDVIDPVNDSVVASLPASGGNPQLPAYDDLTNTLYVSNSAGDTVDVISGATNTIAASVVVQADPAAAVFDPWDGEVYVPDPYTDNLSVISGTLVTATIPLGVNVSAGTFDPGNGDLYFPAENGTLLVFSPLADSVIAAVPIVAGAEIPVYDPANGDIYVGSTPSGSIGTGGSGPSNVTVVSGATNSKVGVIQVRGADHVPPVVDPATGDLYVVNTMAHGLDIVSGATNAVIGEVLLSGPPTAGIVYDSANGDLYVPGSAAVGASLSVVSTVRGVVVTTIPLGGPAKAPAYDPATGELFVPVPMTGDVDVLAGGSELTFAESGLGLGAPWTVVVDGVPVSSSGHSNLSDQIDVPILPGNVTYAIEPLPGYTVSPAAGVVDLGLVAYTVPISFRSIEYPVTLVESGLSAGVRWSATVNGAVENATGTTIALALPNGTYPYSVAAVAGYTLIGGSGNFTVASAPVEVGFGFAPLPPDVPSYVVTVEESGLTAGTGWSAVFDGVAGSTTGRSLNFTVPTGVYAFEVEPLSGYTATPSSGMATVGANYLVTVAFTASPTPPPVPTSTSSSGSSGFSGAEVAAVGIAAAALVLAVGAIAVAFALGIRGRRLPSGPSPTPSSAAAAPPWSEEPAPRSPPKGGT